MSIKKSLQTSILLLAVIPVIIMAISSYIIATTRYAQINEENTKNMANNYSHAFASKLQSQIIETSSLANTNDIKNYLLEKINSPNLLLTDSSSEYNSIKNSFTQVAKDFDQTVQYYLYDIDGYLVVSSTDTFDADWSEVMSEPVTNYKDVSVISNSRFSEIDLDIVCPVIVKQKIVGLLRTSVSSDYFGNYIQYGKNLSNQYFVIDENGEPLFGYEEDPNEDIKLIKHIQEVFLSKNNTEPVSINDTFTEDRHYIYGYATVEGYNWLYIIRQNTDTYTRIVSSLPILLIVLLLVVTVISKYISQNLATRYTQPILELCDKMQAAADGQLDVQCDTNWFGEYESLATNFNEMMNIISRNYNDISNAQFLLENKQQELKTNYEHIEEIAYHDALTGLYNRTAFYKYAEEILSDKKLKKKNHGIIFIDLDGFKSINDTLGHDYGDLLLKEVSNKLLSFMEPNDLFARNGGDEFVILKNNYGTMKRLEDFLSNLVSIASTPFELKDETVRVTLSAGAALYPQHGTTLTELMKNADIAMYTAKNAGKNSYTFFNVSMEDDINRRNDLIDILRNAITNKDVYLLYQPQADVSTGEIVGCEALMRLNAPIVGFVSPDEFIPIAEESGLIDDLGEWALIEACSFNQRLMDEGYKPIQISVNVSTAQLHGDRLLKAIHNLKKHTTMPLHYLEIELTESVLMKNFDHNLTLIKKLKAMGIRIALDDFGTGYSSFSYLTKIPIDTLKIDKTFIDNICENENDQYITETIIKLAHKLNIKVIAEGVETLEQLRILQSHTCDVLQGYFFSRAISEKDFIEMLQINS